MDSTHLKAALTEASERLANASKNKSRSAAHEVRYGLAYQKLVRANRMRVLETEIEPYPALCAPKEPL